MKFASKYRELRIIMRPMTKQIVGLSSQIIPGRSIQFNNFEYETNDPEEIEFIKNTVDFRKRDVTVVEEVDQDEMILKMADAIREKKAPQVAATVVTEETSVGEEQVCEVCGFKSQSRVGIAAHRRSHK